MSGRSLKKRINRTGVVEKFIKPKMRGILYQLLLYQLLLEQQILLKIDLAMRLKNMLLWELVRCLL